MNQAELEKRQKIREIQERELFLTANLKLKGYKIFSEDEGSA